MVFIVGELILGAWRLFRAGLSLQLPCFRAILSVHAQLALFFWLLRQRLRLNVLQVFVTLSGSRVAGLVYCRTRLAFSRMLRTTLRPSRLALLANVRASCKESGFESLI